MKWEPQQEPQRGRDIENGEAGAFISHQSVIYEPKPRAVSLAATASSLWLTQQSLQAGISAGVKRQWCKSAFVGRTQPSLTLSKVPPAGKQASSSHAGQGFA